MSRKELKVYREATKTFVTCVCLNYEQFITDCDMLTLERYRKFNINPKKRLQNKIEKIVDEIFFKVRSLPFHFCLRLEHPHSICNCRIDFTFEVLDKDFLQEDIRGNELTEDELKACLKPEIDYIVLYVGMNR